MLQLPAAGEFGAQLGLFLHDEGQAASATERASFGVDGQRESRYAVMLRLILNSVGM